jgi:hypothetical protein
MSAAEALRLVLTGGWLASTDIITETASMDDVLHDEQSPFPAASSTAGLEAALSAEVSQDLLSARQLVAAITVGAVSTDISNVETNRNLWNAYASEWSADKVCSSEVPRGPCSRVVHVCLTSRGFVRWQVKLIDLMNLTQACHRPWDLNGLTKPRCNKCSPNSSLFVPSAECSFNQSTFNY